MSPELTVRDNPDAQRYEIGAGDERVGFLSYRLAPGTITLLHAEVDPAREGRGIGSRLVHDTLEDVRARRLAVRPVCPFVAAYIERTPEYRDLVI